MMREQIDMDHSENVSSIFLNKKDYAQLFKSFRHNAFIGDYTTRVSELHLGAVKWHSEKKVSESLDKTIHESTQKSSDTYLTRGENQYF